MITLIDNNRSGAKTIKMTFEPDGIEMRYKLDFAKENDRKPLDEVIVLDEKLNKTLILDANGLSQMLGRTMDFHRDTAKFTFTQSENEAPVVRSLPKQY